MSSFHQSARTTTGQQQVYTSMNGKQCKHFIQSPLRRYAFRPRSLPSFNSSWLTLSPSPSLSPSTFTDRSAFPGSSSGSMSFTPYYQTPSSSARNSQSSSSSSSFSSTPTMVSPLFSRRASYSSSDDSEEELETPNSSPQLIGLDAKHSTGQAGGKGKGKALDLEDLHHINGEIIPFSLLDISEDEGVTPTALPLPQRPTFGTPSSVSLPAATSTSPVTTRQPTLVYPPGLPIPPSLSQSTPQKPTPPPVVSTVSTPAASSRPRPQQPSPPSRQQEEANRGRSRWPRILWSSELDSESISVLRSYHSRVVGGDLPVLKQGMSPREVQKWSRKMEDAGI
ncbi:hypothetical protein JCM3765_004031 [Sporobolomyces pararoseus]